MRGATLTSWNDLGRFWRKTGRDDNLTPLTLFSRPNSLAQHRLAPISLDFGKLFQRWFLKKSVMSWLQAGERVPAVTWVRGWRREGVKRV